MAVHWNKTCKMNIDLANEIKDGLSSSPKTLPSKYFYDEKGSALFSAIMQLPEYYLTNAELEIFTSKSKILIENLNLKKENYFELIELGAGDGYKTIEFLKALTQEAFNFSYSPIDISYQALKQIEQTVLKVLPDIKLQLQQGDYFKTLQELKKSSQPKIVMFLGSNLGNMQDEIAHNFLKQLSFNLSIKDKLILGIDLKKNADIITPAYNDSQGITRDFNLNLLVRINKELEANFNIEQFEHTPSYDEKEGIAISSILSKSKQSVYIKAINQTFYFDKDEKIFTEISRKYDDYILQKICKNTGFHIIHKTTDKKSYFADYILEKKE